MTSRVMVALRIAPPPTRVFEAFTGEIGQWWQPHGLFQLGDPPGGRPSIEPGVGGRLRITYPDGASDVVGEVTVWEPPDELALTWSPTSFSAGQATEVRVRFESVDVDATRVVVEHLGWDTIPQDHAARHTIPLHPFQSSLAEWWRDLLGALGDRIGATDRA
jgi:uncharacterized protein YndB with AHSA1/START domain